MKETINRFAKGILDDDPPVLSVSPEEFRGTLPFGETAGFTIEAECLNGRSLRGVCFCDEQRVSLTTSSFLGRMNHLSFTVSTAGLPEGDALDFSVFLLTSAGEAEIPAHFVIGEKKTEPSGERAREITGEPVPFPKEEKNPEEEVLSGSFPEDDALLTEVCTLLIEQSAAGALAFSFYREAVRRNLPVTHLYESYMGAFPADCTEKIPREILLYYSYEKGIHPSVADRLYRNVIENEPAGSELYSLYEPYMRDHAMESVLHSRMNPDLAVIYDRMIYPDMIDPKAARILPDVVMTHRITVEDARVKSVYAKYPELSGTVSVKAVRGTAWLPVYFRNVKIGFTGEGGTELCGVSFTDVPMMNRPDLLKRCFSLCPSHPMLTLSAVREILSGEIENDEEKEMILSALRELPFEKSFRDRAIRALCRYGEDPSWIDEYDPLSFGPETGGEVFRAYLHAGRMRDAYIFIRKNGMERAAAPELSRLADSLLSGGEKPVTEGLVTDRFFLCLCARILREERDVPESVLRLLCEEYEGPSRILVQLLFSAKEKGIPVHDLSERILSVLLFAGEREHLDDVFRVYASEGVQKENLVRAYFTVRMNDYFEGNGIPSDDIFDALTGYFMISRYCEGLPEIFMIGLTRYFSEKEVLTEAETALCQKLTDILIAKDMVFLYTKALRKKIRIPAAVCERFFVEYHGVKGSDPRLYARIRQEDREMKPVLMKRVYRNTYVAGFVLFYGDELKYEIYDRAKGSGLCGSGTITVKKPHIQGDDRFALLNRMTKSLAERDTKALREDMIRYSVDTEINRKLFSIQ